MDGFALINGACHCGNIRFAIRWPESESEIPVRKCGCSFCLKHVGAWTSHPRSELDVAIADESLVTKYSFGTKTADFYVCSVCGVVPLVLSVLDDKLYAVVNVNSFEDVDSFSFSESSTDFDGENVGARLERRKQNWIANVRFCGQENSTGGRR